MTIVTGLFRNWDNAADAVDMLSTSGFRANDISLIAKEDVARRRRDDAGAGRGADVASGATAPGAALGAPPAGLAGTGASTVNAMGMGGFYFSGPLWSAHFRRGGADQASLAGQAGADLAADMGQTRGRDAAAGREETPDAGKNREDDVLASLTDAGIPRDRAQAYVEAIRRGEVLVAVQTDNAAQARNLLNQANAAQVSGI